MRQVLMRMRCPALSGPSMAPSRWPDRDSAASKLRHAVRFRRSVAATRSAGYQIRGISRDRPRQYST
jgi:hypothetical protein